jgi:hypothetical protein
MYTMKESVAIAKEADAKKGVSPTRSDKSIHRVRNGPERQLGSLRGVIANITRDGGTPSVESIATELSGMPTGERAPALLALQQTHGNRYVQRVVAGIQAKLVVGQPGDVYEQEADRVADQVMRMPEPEVQRQAEEEKKKKEEEKLIQTKTLSEQITPLVQRYAEEKEEEEEELLQTKENPGLTPGVIHDLEARIQSLKGGGQPLPEANREFMERRFGIDFSGAKLHTDSDAAQMSRELNAEAFTYGRDIYFGAGRYSPGTLSGKRLLAHELTHVVQQGCITSLYNAYSKAIEASKARTNSQSNISISLERDIPNITTCMSSSIVARWSETPIFMPDVSAEIIVGYRPEENQVYIRGEGETDFLNLHYAGIIRDDHIVDMTQMDDIAQSEIADSLSVDLRVLTGHMPEPQYSRTQRTVTSNNRLMTNGAWNGGNILRRLTQYDQMQTTLYDESRCLPTSVLAIHIITGQEAVMRVAQQIQPLIMNRIICNNSYNEIVQNHARGLLQGIRNLSTENTMRTATYGNLSELGEALFVWANRLILNDIVEAEISGLQPRDVLLEGTMEGRAQEIIRIGHRGVSSGVDREFRDLCQYVGGWCEPRPPHLHGAHGWSATEELPNIGERFGMDDLGAVLTTLRRHSNVGLLIGVPAGSQTGSLPHAVLLGVNHERLVFLYDPSPLQGHQITWIDQNQLPSSLEAYFLGRWRIVGRLAGASETARRQSQ